MQISLLGAVQTVQEDEITERRCLLKSQKLTRCLRRTGAAHHNNCLVELHLVLTSCKWMGVSPETRPLIRLQTNALNGRDHQDLGSENRLISLQENSTFLWQHLLDLNTLLIGVSISND